MIVKALGAGCLLLALACGFLFWRVESLSESQGKLKASVDQLSATVAAKTQATQSRARADSNVRKLAPAEKLEKLR